MTTIKSYSDLEQSKKLAEILPIESADMCYMYLGTEDKEYEEIPICAPAMEGDLCAWSLAALFKVISNIFKYNLDYNGISFILTVGDFEVSNKTIVDACVTMIEKLHELKML